MFCYQCEQTAGGSGCNSYGACGKAPETAALQDLLVHVAQDLASVAKAAGQARDMTVHRALLDALFTTVTNVNFDPGRVADLVRATVAMRESIAGSTNGVPRDASTDRLVSLGDDVTIAKRTETRGADLTGLEELIMYGLKGVAAYAHHAMVLGHTDADFAEYLVDTLDFLRGEHDADTLTGRALKTGEVTVSVLALLDRANTDTYGHPVPTPVRTTPVAGRAILVSGHDLLDLYQLLEQTEGTGIQVYTHGEMLPAHGYPGLKKFKHLAGNYGGAWQDQMQEFDAFPGAILMTTNCIQKPRESYKGRIFTSGLVAWPGVQHIADQDFAPVIEAALAAPGFSEDAEPHEITVGFGHNAVLGVADTVIDAVKTGAIRHFLLIGGCDGAKSGRNYFTDMALQAPDDTVVLTLGCGKYRFNKEDFGTTGGLPRLLDMGQCNDAYSAVVVAQALADAFDTDINGLPLSLVVSWYEQKAVCILLALLHLGVRDIRLGPTLPAFIAPAVLQVLVDTFALKPTGTVDSDLKAILG